MQIGLILLGGIAAAWGLLLLAYIAVRHGSALGWREMLTAFGMGGAAAYLAFLAGFPLGTALATVGDPLLAATINAFVTAGLIEELAKAFVLLAAVMPFAGVRRPADGVVASAAVALGFGAIESVFRFIETGGPDMGMVGGRFLVAGPAHLVDGLIVGTFVELALSRRAGRGGLIAAGVLLAALAHGAYDAIVFTLDVAPSALLPALGPAVGPATAILALMLPLSAAVLIAARRAARLAPAESPDEMPMAPAADPSRRPALGSLLLLLGLAGVLAGGFSLLVFAGAVAAADEPPEVRLPILVGAALLAWWPLTFGLCSLADGVRLLRHRQPAPAAYGVPLRPPLHNPLRSTRVQGTFRSPGGL